jgi:hypothetical protein
MRHLRLLVAVVLVGCARSPVTQLPQYEADVLPVSETKAGITIGIDEIKKPERAQRYFGADLIKDGIVPVSIVVSNHGKSRVAVKPSDVLVHRGKDVIDPLPIELVAATAKQQRSIERAAFKETVLSPNESYRGVMFFAAPAPKKTLERFFAALSALGEGEPKIRVGMTNLDTGERLVFGPFSLASY